MQFVFFISIDGHLRTRFKYQLLPLSLPEGYPLSTIDMPKLSVSDLNSQFSVAMKWLCPQETNSWNLPSLCFVDLHNYVTIWEEWSEISTLWMENGAETRVEKTFHKYSFKFESKFQFSHVSLPFHVHFLQTVSWKMILAQIFTRYELQIVCSTVNFAVHNLCAVD